MDFLAGMSYAYLAALIDISSSVFRSGKNPEIIRKFEMCFKALAKKQLRVFYRSNTCLWQYLVIVDLKNIAL
jgi:hypothetical protein